MGTSDGVLKIRNLWLIVWIYYFRTRSPSDLIDLVLSIQATAGTGTAHDKKLTTSNQCTAEAQHQTNGVRLQSFYSRLSTERHIVGKNPETSCSADPAWLIALHWVERRYSTNPHTTQSNAGPRLAASKRRIAIPTSNAVRRSRVRSHPSAELTKRVHCRR